jgi:hypothetical protein
VPLVQLGLGCQLVVLALVLVQAVTMVLLPHHWLVLVVQPLGLRRGQVVVQIALVD